MLLLLNFSSLLTLFSSNIPKSEMIHKKICQKHTKVFLIIKKMKKLMKSNISEQKPQTQTHTHIHEKIKRKEIVLKKLLPSSLHTTQPHLYTHK
jgi:hypothetical protein